MSMALGRNSRRNQTAAAECIGKADIEAAIRICNGELELGELPDSTFVRHKYGLVQAYSYRRTVSRNVGLRHSARVEACTAAAGAAAGEVC